MCVKENPEVKRKSKSVNERGIRKIKTWKDVIGSNRGSRKESPRGISESVERGRRKDANVHVAFC